MQPATTAIRTKPALSGSFSLRRADIPSLSDHMPNKGHPALANKRVQTNAAGQMVRNRKTRWREGTEHLMMSPIKFL